MRGDKEAFQQPMERFHNLADVRYGESARRSKLRVLLLADDRHVANVVQDHISAFSTYSRHRYTVVNPIHAAPLSPRTFFKFDVILIHYSIYVLGEYFLPMEWKSAVVDFKGLKAQIIQDEYRNIDSMRQRMHELGISAVFSSLQKSAMKKVYECPSLGGASFYSCLPGYIADSFFALNPPPLADRPLDVVYRGRNLPPQLGRHAQDKRLIGEQILATAKTYDLKVDIASDEDSRIYGEAWSSFLMSGRATLGVEGGASIFDFDGEIARQVETYQSENPGADFDEVMRVFLHRYEGNIVHKTLTPKLLEAIAAKTALILYPGEYRGILKPGRHYIVLERDGSNIGEVVRLLRNHEYLQNLVDQTHQEILTRADLSKRFYVRQIDDVLSQKVRWYSWLPRLVGVLRNMR